MVVNVQIAFTPYAQTPAGMFGERMNHVVEEADARVHRDDLRGSSLGRMFGSFAIGLRFRIDFIPEWRGLELWEGAAVNVE